MFASAASQRSTSRGQVNRPPKMLGFSAAIWVADRTPSGSQKPLLRQSIITSGTSIGHLDPQVAERFQRVEHLGQALLLADEVRLEHGAEPVELLVRGGRLEQDQ